MAHRARRMTDWRKAEALKNSASHVAAGAYTFLIDA
jgi:hypothetical protein